MTLIISIIIFIVAFILGVFVGLSAQKMPKNTQGEIQQPDAYQNHVFTLNDVCHINNSIQFDYADAKGNRTRRTVDIKEFGNARNDLYILAYCHLRQELRHFKLNRMSHCIDADTGEVIDEVSRYLKKQFRMSTDYTLNRLFQDHFDSLVILFYVAKADGRFMKAEKIIACELCKQLSKDKRLTPDMMDTLFFEMDLPSISDFKESVRSIFNNIGDTHCKKILQASEAIVHTQKKITDAEQEALDYMHQIFISSQQT